MLPELKQYISQIEYNYYFREDIKIAEMSKIKKSEI